MTDHTARRPPRPLDEPRDPDAQAQRDPNWRRTRTYTATRHPHFRPTDPLLPVPEQISEFAPPRRRRRWLRTLATTGALASLPFIPLSSGSSSGSDPSYQLGVAQLERTRTENLQRAVADDDADPARAGGNEEPHGPIAELEDLELESISEDTEVVGFHESLGNTLSVEPADAVHENHNPAKSDVPVDARAPEEPTSLVLPTRNRGSDAQSAVDVAIPHGSDVAAPVSGEVVNVQEYSLYGQHTDWRIEIVPDDRPDVVVIMLHVTGPQVQIGDRVTAGSTVVADSPAQFPFESQIDRFAAREAGRALPHVHIEIKQIG